MSDRDDFQDGELAEDPCTCGAYSNEHEPDCPCAKRIGPFPAEAPPGSPEAVAQAARSLGGAFAAEGLAAREAGVLDEVGRRLRAETVRTLAPYPAHSPEELAELLKMRPPYSIADLAKIPRLLTTLEALLTEVERLRADVLSQRDAKNRFLQVAGRNLEKVCELTDENKRLMAERDALADALEALLKGRDGYEVVSFIPVIWIPGEPGSARQGVANTVSAEQSRAALRAAGRLPNKRG